ncbi:hypothetical protein B0H13DRAFT_1916528 [Mycena leptocephala]|nr:hypothetical protein B0H13DRAFT_1916528 [Mycena leptocephala]
MSGVAAAGSTRRSGLDHSRVGQLIGQKRAHEDVDSCEVVDRASQQFVQRRKRRRLDEPLVRTASDPRSVIHGVAALNTAADASLHESDSTFVDSASQQLLTRRKRKRLDEQTVHPENVDALSRFRQQWHAEIQGRPSSTNATFSGGSSVDVPSWVGPATWGLRNTYTMRDSGDFFRPFLVGTDTVEIRLPFVSPGHQLDTIWWKQLQSLNRVVEVESSSDAQTLWDPIRYYDASCTIHSVTPWSSDPVQQVDTHLRSSRIYIRIDPGCTIVTCSPSKIFTVGPVLSSSSSTLHNTPVPPPSRSVSQGDLIVARCSLHCEHVPIFSATSLFSPSFSRLTAIVQQYIIRAIEMSVVVY